MKYKKAWFPYVTSNKGFPQFSTAKTTKQNKELWLLSWRFVIVVRNLTVILFLSVSYDYVFE